ncbi:MAG: CapA family protein, partial [Bacteroidales bacterium]
MSLLKSIILLLSLFIVNLQAQNVELRFVGDAMLHSRQLDLALKNGNYSFDSYFSDLIPLLDKSDLNIVNLELALGGAPYTGYPC